MKRQTFVLMENQKFGDGQSGCNLVGVGLAAQLSTNSLSRLIVGAPEEGKGRQGGAAVVVAGGGTGVHGAEGVRRPRRSTSWLRSRSYAAAAEVLLLLLGLVVWVLRVLGLWC